MFGLVGLVGLVELLNRQLNSLTCHAGLDPASPGHTWIHTFGSMRIYCVFYCRVNSWVLRRINSDRRTVYWGDIEEKQNVQGQDWP